MSRKILSAVYMLLVAMQATAQETQLPYTFNAEYKFDMVNNFAGGRKTGAAYVGRMDAMIDLSTAKAGWYEGGTFFIRGINAHGTLPSSNLIQDIQPVSRIEATPRTSLFEFWYRQEWKRLSLIVGQLDMNSLMATNPLSSGFLNTSFGMYPSVALNASLAIYPSAAAGLFFEYRQSKVISVRGGAFDSAPISFSENPHNLKWNTNIKKGLFYTGEIELKEVRDEKVIAHYKIGGYFNSAKTYNVSDSSNIVQSGRGVYISADRQLIAEKDNNQGLSMFLQAGTSPGEESFVDAYLCTGLSYKGLLKGRENDVFGIGIAKSMVNKTLAEAYPLQYNRSRTLIEIFYNAKLGDHFSIQPDLQYILHTGANPNFKNAFAGLIRGVINF